MNANLIKWSPLVVVPAVVWTVCLFVAAPRCVEIYPLLAGWLGMIGLIFLLHFGLFHGLAALWQDRGFGAEPLMNRPMEARRVSELWGRRWNRAFQWLTWRYVFRPLRKRVTAPGALWMSFLLSGLIHELVITVLPFIYGWAAVREGGI
ncbi:MAG: MBOAT family protein [Kiritimatiellae bacterium]|jgi:D-alanyl-lipoteichoic acid acyltransferase DltB (MBOAT superfamily)|nr:MBOAT family protein [Kiritimatiellia bacterium]